MLYWLSDLQFLRPLWLCGIPVIALWYWLQRRQQRTAGWGSAIAQKNLQHLQINRAGTKFSWLPHAAIGIACIALAGPGMKSIPDKTGHSAQARVFILDLSPSMLARDVKPDRLSVAKLKLIDMLRTQSGKESALVVFAGSTHRVTPLTNDPQIIIELVPVLEPNVIPVSGSQAEDAVEMAIQLITDAGLTRGDLVMITDGLHDSAIASVKDNWSPSFRLSILGIGTKQGAPIPLPANENRQSVTNSTNAGRYVEDTNGQTVMAKLDSDKLKQLAVSTGGRYSALTNDSQDIDKILSLAPLNRQVTEQDDDKLYDQIHDAGYWLLLALLPVALLSFRKNLVWVFALFVIVPIDSHAFEWIDLWLTKDQQAQREMQKQQYKKASVLFENSRWQFVSLYRLGKYTESTGAISQMEYADDLYNRGNALALSGDLDAALVSYRMAAQLYTTDDEKADTLHNISLLRQIQSNDDAEEESQSRGSGAADGNQQGQVSSDPSTDETSEGEQSQIGGVAGGDSTLQQSAAQQQSSGSAATNTPDPTVADDAQQADSQTIETDLSPEDTALLADQAIDPARAEENSNPVLSPYSEQWLRELPIEPGGYLRRKFSYQDQLRQSEQDSTTTRTTEIRY